MDDYGFSGYFEKLQHLSQCINGPDTLSFSSNMEKSFHEIEEFKCVLTATHDLLDYPYEPFAPFTSHQTFHRFRVKEWTSSTIFKETLNWKFEEPTPTTGRDANRAGQDDSSVNEMNSCYRDERWRKVLEKWDGCTTPKPGSLNPHFLDYLGLCIWDKRRQGFFGLALLYELYPGIYSGPIRNPKYFAESSCFATRWLDLLFEELTRLPGGQLRQFPEGLEKLARIDMKRRERRFTQPERDMLQNNQEGMQSQVTKHAS